MKKQMTYANNRKIPYVALIGENEMNSGLITVKDMKNGEQQKLTVDEIITLITK
jgi:histidyl-tRNA synthetase